MYKSLILVAMLSAVTGLSACGPQPISANCAGLGLLGGGLLGAATDNDLATSALAGGVVGGIAGSQGYCQ